MGQDSGTDTGSNGSECTALTAGMLDAAGFNPGAAVAFNGPGGDAGDGHPLTLQFEFYEPESGSLQGTFDLSGTDYQSYATCPICVLAYSNDGGGKLFFQKSGSITLTADPTVDGHLVATISNLELQEVTIDQELNTTPVAGGQCTTYGASLSLDHDKAPNAWTCEHSAYIDGAACDCMCGAPDPDCSGAATTTNGCTADQVCASATCIAPPADACADATTLTIGTPVLGTTVGATNNYSNGLDGATCTTFAQAGSDVAYMVHLTAGTAYTVSLSGVDPQFDVSLSLVGPGDATVCTADPITTCVAGSDTGVEGDDESLMFTPTTTGDYYVIVDSFYDDEFGAFTVLVQ